MSYRNKKDETMSAPHVCQHEGCGSTETQLYTYPVPVDGVKLSEWLCPEHAAEAGFCYLCGWFGAGAEEYDFSPIKGVCGECLEMLRDELGENDDDDDWYDYDFTEDDEA